MIRERERERETQQRPIFFYRILFHFFGFCVVEDKLREREGDFEKKKKHFGKIS